MRRVRYAVAVSLDGFIAGPDGEADWILIDPEIDFDAFASEFDTLLMGRRTFETMAGAGADPGKWATRSFSGMKVVVASRTLKPGDYRGVAIVGENLQEFVTTLKAQPGKDIWLWGGGDLFRSLLQLDLVDTLEVAVIPVVLGQGIPLLPAIARPVSLTLTSHHVYAKTGTVALAYNVKPKARPAKSKRSRNARAE
ncbi:MAG: dihydrofolate reductase family protein [Acidobacteriota bacterium]